MKKHVIDSGQIVYLQGDDTYSHLHLPDEPAEWIRPAQSRSEMYRLDVVRISRRVFVNPNYVTYLGPSNRVFSGGKRIWIVRLTSGQEFPISRRRTGLVVTVLQDLMKKPEAEVAI